ncbi:MAG TPA: GDSL-type esterase/lipase family protein [Candidatus Polarisedimenticolia bacterium]|nr:GDSL-type esterase/lipase family protein [Candidatus Polarisedimenticolia bacterium]
MSRAARTRGRRWLFNLALACAVSLATLGLAELALRFTAHRLLRPNEWLTLGQIFRKVDPPMGFSLEPDSTQLLVSGGAYTFRAKINAMGLRDIEHSREPAPGVPRVLVLGDSFMYGQGVAMDRTLPRRLQEHLPGTEVINAGIPGYDLGQEYLYYRERMRAYRPDLVLLGFFINDLNQARELDVTYGPDGLPLEYRRNDRMLAKDEPARPAGLRSLVTGWLNQHSLLYTLVRKRVESLGRKRVAGEAPSREKKREGAPYAGAFLARTDPEWTAAWERAGRVLDALKSEVESDGATFAVVLVPASWQLSEHGWRQWIDWLEFEPGELDRRGPQLRVLAWCARTSTPCLDLSGALETEPLESLHIPYDLHWTESGHEAAARAVAGFIRDGRLLPSAGAQNEMR